MFFSRSEPGFDEIGREEAPALKGYFVGLRELGLQEAELRFELLGRRFKHLHLESELAGVGELRAP